LASALCRSRLTSLNLGENQISAQGAKALASDLGGSQLTSLKKFSSNFLVLKTLTKNYFFGKKL